MARLQDCTFGEDGFITATATMTYTMRPEEVGEIMKMHKFFELVADQLGDIMQDGYEWQDAVADVLRNDYGYDDELDPPKTYDQTRALMVRAVNKLGEYRNDPAILYADLGALIDNVEIIRDDLRREARARCRSTQ